MITNIQALTLPDSGLTYYIVLYTDFFTRTYVLTACEEGAVDALVDNMKLQYGVELNVHAAKHKRCKLRFVVLEMSRMYETAKLAEEYGYVRLAL